MQIEKLLNSTLALLEIENLSNSDNFIDKKFVKLYPHLGVTVNLPYKNFENFNQNLNTLYVGNTLISTRFSREKIFKFLENFISNKKAKQENFSTEEANILFKDFEEQPSYDKYIIAPISGIRLDTLNKIKISVFEIGKTSLLNNSTFKDTEYYIAVKINQIYDEILAVEEAKNKFIDFARLIAFISGREDKKIHIKIGLPVYPSYSHDLMYISTDAYDFLDEMNQAIPNTKLHNLNAEKIPVDNEFFHDNPNFKKIWSLYEKQAKNSKLEQRILNSCIAIGESMLSKNIKNSIIYTSMGYEILFSYDDGALFQKSIGDKLADMLGFLVGTNKRTRLETIKSFKKFYSLRSSLVHGGDKKVDNSYQEFNILLRIAIKELLNNNKFAQTKTIENLYELLKDAQNSY